MLLGCKLEYVQHPFPPTFILCIYCFKDGRFTQNVTMDEMIEHCANFVDDFNEGTGLNLTRDEAVRQMQIYFPTLKRWGGN